MEKDTFSGAMLAWVKGRGAGIELPASLRHRLRQERRYTAFIILSGGKSGTKVPTARLDHASPPAVCRNTRLIQLSPACSSIVMAGLTRHLLTSSGHTPRLGASPLKPRKASASTTALAQVGVAEPQRVLQTRGCLCLTANYH
jgi:hypothetical protein